MRTEMCQIRPLFLFPDQCDWQPTLKATCARSSDLRASERAVGLPGPYAPPNLASAGRAAP